MKYQEKSFTVPASAGSRDYCAEHGHTEPCSRGTCLRCSARLDDINTWPLGFTEILGGHVEVYESLAELKALNDANGAPHE